MSLPAAGYLENAARTEGEMKTALADQLKGIKQIPGAGIADQALTIASGSVTPASGSSAILVIDTEASGATDDLTNIVLTNIDDGAMVWVRNANAARVVVAKHSAGGSGQMSLASGGDVVLADPDRHWLLLKRNGSLLLEVARVPSADLAPLLSKSANYTTTPADRGRFIDCTASLTLTLLAAATAGRGFEQTVQCSGGVTTIDPNAAETIGGASTLLLYRGDKVRIVCDGTNWVVVDRHNAQVALDKTIQGLTYAPNGSDASNDIDIAAGVAMDATGVYLLRGSAMTKQLDAAWAPGTNAGMLDTGAVGNNNYFLWEIGRSDTGVVDYLASLSSTAPTMPANYDFKRLLGPLSRSGGANVTFWTRELPGGGLTYTVSKPTTSGTSVDLSVPLPVTRLTGHLSGISSNGTSDYIVQLGDAGGPETSGYLGTGGAIASGSSASTAYTAGFGLVNGPAAAGLYHGQFSVEIKDPVTNEWTFASQVSVTTAGATNFVATGVKSLSAELTTVRLTTAGGANTFDAGSFALTMDIKR